MLLRVRMITVNEIAQMPLGHGIRIGKFELETGFRLLAGDFQLVFREYRVE